MNQQHQRQDEILRKQQVLKQAGATLKNEFVGLDRIIDEVIDSISSWYFFPDLQEKPLVINLWGLTGVGKSSLVNRLSTLLKFGEAFYHFDLGVEKNAEYGMREILGQVNDRENSYPLILAFDEFQHARTINESGVEINEYKNRLIWQILDTGKFLGYRDFFRINELYTLINELKHFITMGVKVRSGYVTQNMEYIQSKHKSFEINEYGESIMRNDKSLLFVPDEFYTIIYKLIYEAFDTAYCVSDKLLSLDGPETVKFLEKVVNYAKSPREVDCSKALVFVLGNLDEAYNMSGVQSTDIDADEFHAESLSISVPEIKRALKERFRTEQIGRLGNQHIIYPAFSKDSFKKIIVLELSKVAVKAKDAFSIEVSFDSSMNDLLYREGVYPTQGTRPLFTTVYQMVQARLGNVMAEMFTHELNGCNVCFLAHTKGVLVEFREGESVRHTMLFEQEFALEKLRKSRNDDMQAITAVHESGHALLSAILLHVMPEVIYATTTDVGAAGFAYIRNKWKYISRKEITLRLAMLLGGFAAERVIYGEENVTTGASSDIERATKFVTQMVRQCGMGSVMGYFDVESSGSSDVVFDNDNRLNHEARDWIAKALKLAEETLSEQQTLLLHMSNYLCDNRQLNHPEIIELLKQHAVNFDTATLIENGDNLFYRAHLKEKVKQLTGVPTEKMGVNGAGVV